MKVYVDTYALALIVGSAMFFTIYCKCLAQEHNMLYSLLSFAPFMHVYALLYTTTWHLLCQPFHNPCNMCVITITFLIQDNYIYLIKAA